METEVPEVDKPSVELWRSLTKELRNPSAHYFFQAQEEIDELFTLLG
jgi:hypothetical protein